MVRCQNPVDHILPEAVRTVNARQRNGIDLPSPELAVDPPRQAGSGDLLLRSRSQVAESSGQTMWMRFTTLDFDRLRPDIPWTSTLSISCCQNSRVSQICTRSACCCSNILPIRFSNRSSSDPFLREQDAEPSGEPRPTPLPFSLASTPSSNTTSDSFV
jgi:hypothetical protein